MKLVIAEKPSAARMLADFIERVEGEKFEKNDGYLEGKEYTITWCIGHLVGLAEPEAYGWSDWSLSELPMIPKQWKLEVLPGTAKQFKIVASLMKDASLVICATDAGREGELIYGLVAAKAGTTKKPQLRLWLNSMAQSDMEKAWKNLIPGKQMEPLYRAAIARAQADWLIGMNLSRGYSLGSGQRKLSVGRGQTATLALLVKRFDEIESFQSTDFYLLKVDWNGLQLSLEENGQRRFPDKDRLSKIADQVQGKTGRLDVFKKQQKMRHPPKPFDLAELQKTANKKFGFKAADTLALAQSLYEMKMITYPRTDSQYIPEAMKDETYDLCLLTAKEEEKSLIQPKKTDFAFFDDKKIGDHFAIIPTGVNGNIYGDQWKIMELIRSQFVMSFMFPEIYDEYKIEVLAEGHRFSGSAVHVVEKGFSSLTQKRGEDKKADKSSESTMSVSRSLNMKKGDEAKIAKTEIKEGKTSSPSHYTEATLITAMETAGRLLTDEALKDAMKERGIGTPATKHSLIERLKEMEYVYTEGKYIIASKKGRELIAMVDEKVSSPEMTGEWEWKLRQVAENKLDATAFIGEIEAYITSLVSSFRGRKVERFAQNLAEDIPEEERCPKCKKHRLKYNEHGLFCESDRCGLKLWTKFAGKKLSEKTLRELLSDRCTGVIKGFKSRAGKKFDASLELTDDWKITFNFDEE